MNKAKIKSVFAVLLGVLIASGLLASMMYYAYKSGNAKISKWMIEAYSDDTNYTNCLAIICERDGGFGIDNLTYQGGKEIPDRYHSKIVVFSDDSKNITDYLKTKIGSQMDFIACFSIYNTISYLPIVQISIDGIEVLNFEEGKKSLLNYAINYAKQ